ncbi:MAG: glycosyltransferase family 2 protein [Lewinellaceae bacterium]|nr:glycosyltransferase family 2 protein [Lewinellaceae bacterium]
MDKFVTDIIIPAHNEEAAIGQVLSAIPRELVREIVVCDNASTDNTAAVARAHGATVLREPRKGYGSACLTGIAYLQQKAATDPLDCVVFLDADFSDHPEELPQLLIPITHHNFDLVIGSRVLGQREKGSLMPQQRFGNWLATTLVRWLYGVRFTDLGPFRAIRWSALQQLGMNDPNYGWTVEMQVRAAKMGLRCTEVPVSYRRRIGTSKVSGTIRGSVLAGYKILWTIFKLL